MTADGSGEFTCETPSGGGGGSYLPLSGGTLTGTLNTQAIDATGYAITGNSLSASSYITSGGNITAGTNGTITGKTLTSTGAITAATTITATGNISGAAISATGAITATGNITGGNINGTAFLYTSDARFKEDIEAIRGKEALRLINALQGVHFNWIGNGKKDIGFIAQDVQKVVPELVSNVEKEDGDHLAVQYGNIVAIAVEAIKEQNRQIASDAKKIEKLEKQNEEMQRKLNLILEKLK